MQDAADHDDVVERVGRQQRTGRLEHDAAARGYRLRATRHDGPLHVGRPAAIAFVGRQAQVVDEHGKRREREWCARTIPTRSGGRDCAPAQDPYCCSHLSGALNAHSIRRFPPRQLYSTNPSEDARRKCGAHITCFRTIRWQTVTPELDAGNASLNVLFRKAVEGAMARSRALSGARPATGRLISEERRVVRGCSARSGSWHPAACVPAAGGPTSAAPVCADCGLLCVQVLACSGAENPRGGCARDDAAAGDAGRGSVPARVAVGLRSVGHPALQTLESCVRRVLRASHGRLHPLSAPAAPTCFARATQLRVTQCHGDARQVAGLAQRRIPALLIEQLLDVCEVARQHA